MALLTIRGTGAAPGIALGQAYVYRGPDPTEGQTSTRRLTPAERDAELERLQAAIAAAADQLQSLSARISAEVGAAEAGVFEAQGLFLQDPALIDPVQAAVREQGTTASTAIGAVFEEAALDLERLSDPYLRARAADLRDVKTRLLALLRTGRRGPSHVPGQHAVVVARDLTPSDTVGLDQDQVEGIVLVEGTLTSHAAILARGLGLPLVIGAGTAVWDVKPGERMIVDGTNGTVLIGPDPIEWEEYRRRNVSVRWTQQGVEGRGDLSAATLDGRHIDLAANASSEPEARLALRQGAHGIGLLRTEFLLAALEGGGDDRPNEAALAAAYGVIFEVVRGRPVTVRAMDAGGDKPLSIVEFEGEANPFLGWRGIRVLLDEPDLFRSQIRAALRAAERHEIDLRLMFPMVTTLDELRRGRELVEEVRREDHIALAHPLRIGVMIEVPAAALIADALAAEADFFSIGTNDLIQYTVAADRGNRRVDHLCRLEHPGVLRLIDVVVRAGHAQGRLVGVCGEAAGDLSALPLLVGLGVDELSVGAARVSEVRRYVRRVRWNEVQRMAAQALTLATTEDVARLVAEFVRSNDLVSAQEHTVPRSRCNIL